MRGTVGDYIDVRGFFVRGVGGGYNGFVRCSIWRVTTNRHSRSEVS